MNVMLTRLPDGTVNAEPGDAVEYFENGEWKPAEYTGNVVDYDDHRKFYWQVLFEEDDEWVGIFRTHVRHARGGAGHLRLQVARLREALSEVVADAKEDNAWDVWQPAEQVLADVDNYEYAEPEA